MCKQRKTTTKNLTLECSHSWKSRWEWNVQKRKQTKRDKLPWQFLPPHSSYSTLAAPQLNEICGELQKKTRVTFFLRTQNRNTHFPFLLSTISSKFAVSLSRWENLILENGSLGWKKGWAEWHPKAARDHLLRRAVSLFWKRERELRGDHALWVKENGAAAIKTAGLGNWVPPESITQPWQMRKERDGETQLMPHRLLLELEPADEVVA